MSPKAPPATMQSPCGPFASALRYPIPSKRKAMSRVKKRKQKATVDRRVQSKRRKVKMNHPIKKRPNEL